MPYITQQRRDELGDDQQPAGKRLPQNAGELNYVLTRVIQEYALTRPVSYQVLNDIVGALESCKAEFQRRVVAPYEDSKMKQNGDVYE